MYLQLSVFIYQLFSLFTLLHHTYPFLRITSTKIRDMSSLVKAVVTLTADFPGDSAVFGAELTDRYEACHGWSHLSDPREMTKVTSRSFHSSVVTPSLPPSLQHNLSRLFRSKKYPESTSPKIKERRNRGILLLTKRSTSPQRTSVH